MFTKGKTTHWVWIILILGFAWRYSVWRGEKREVEAFCASHQPLKNQLNPIASFEGDPFYEFTEEGPTVVFYRPKGSDQKILPTRVVARGLDLREPLSAHRMRISGPVRCERKFKNPSRKQDGETYFFVPEVRFSGTRIFFEKLPQQAGLGSRLYLKTRQILDEAFSGYPGLHALVIAVWTGRGEGLPPALLVLYRDLGMLPVLALSGQHVLILSGLFHFVLLLLLRMLYATSFRRTIKWLSYFQIWVPAVATVILYFTSAGVPSMRRTAGMVLAVSLLKIRHIYSSKLQTCLSALGLMLLWNPHEMLSVGFLLSGIFTALTIALSFQWHTKGFIASAAFLPLLGFPVTAFFFGKIAWLTWPAQITLGLVWELAWIPLGFLLPIFHRFLPHLALSALEALWSYFVALQLKWLSPLSQTAVSTVRPTWWELFLVESLLIFLILQLFLRWTASSEE